MNQEDSIYLDFSATTPVDPQVLDAMLPYFNNDFGNPSSIHMFGQQAETVLERSRETIAHYLNCQSSEIVFTSGGTESDNLALRGIAFAARNQRQANHILISSVEHEAISRTARQLSEVFGFEIEQLPVDKYGMVRSEDLVARIRSDTAVVSIIFANNEIGTINPISEIGTICRDIGVPFHTDGVQAGAYLSLDVEELHVDLMSIGAHKFYGPKGVGALYIRKGTPLMPVQTGGIHELGKRAGTPNIPYIVGMSEALKLAQEEKDSLTSKLRPMRNKIMGWVLENIPESRLTGHPSRRLPHHASFAFRGVDGNNLLMMLDLKGFACSSGSACKTGLPEPSDVLKALGFSPEWSLGSLRVTLGKTTKTKEVNSFLKTLPELIHQARNGL